MHERKWGCSALLHGDLSLEMEKKNLIDKQDSFS